MKKPDDPTLQYFYELEANGDFDSIVLSMSSMDPADQVQSAPAVAYINDLIEAVSKDPSEENLKNLEGFTKALAKARSELLYSAGEKTDGWAESINAGEIPELAGFKGDNESIAKLAGSLTAARDDEWQQVSNLTSYIGKLTSVNKKAAGIGSLGAYSLSLYKKHSDEAAAVLRSGDPEADKRIFKGMMIKADESKELGIVINKDVRPDAPMFTKLPLALKAMGEAQNAEELRGAQRAYNDDLGMKLAEYKLKAADTAFEAKQYMADIDAVERLKPKNRPKVNKGESKGVDAIANTEFKMIKDALKAVSNMYEQKDEAGNIVKMPSESYPKALGLLKRCVTLYKCTYTGTAKDDRAMKLINSLEAFADSAGVELKALGSSISGNKDVMPDVNREFEKMAEENALFDKAIRRRVEFDELKKADGKSPKNNSGVSDTKKEKTTDTGIKNKTDETVKDKDIKRSRTFS